MLLFIFCFIVVSSMLLCEIVLVSATICQHNSLCCNNLHFGCHYLACTVVILIFVNVVVVVVTLVTVVAIRWHAAKYATNGRPHKSHPNNAFHSQQETSTEKDRESEVLQENGLPGCHCKLSKIADFLLTKIANIFWPLPKQAYKNAGQMYSN